MITHGNEQIEEHGATMLHFEFHVATLFEVVTIADNESEIMSSKLGVRIRCILICPSSRGKDGGNLHALSKTLLAKCKAFEVLKTITFGRTARLVSDVLGQDN